MSFEAPGAAEVQFLRRSFVSENYKTELKLGLT
jgi:hypothetical protein